MPESEVRTLTITTGSSRLSKVWKEEVLTFDALLARLKKPKVTAETMSEYRNFSKDEKVAVKDVGGFIGGKLSGTQRTKGALVFRSLITLDLDYVDTDTAEVIKSLNALDVAYVMHPTHSWQPEAPKLRVVIPLAEDVSANRYEPLARKVAKALNMEWFDPTTYQGERLMFWPSVPCDVDYSEAWAQVSDKPFLHPSDYLAQWDWQNLAEWPRSSRELAVVHEHKSTQQDPREKDGIIGAFCRAFSITEAIERFLGDVYELEAEGRYTFKGGTTKGGLVVYDDLFAYSHHGTDPAALMLCNAFDLVRIHKFGRLDAKVRVGRKPSELPSFQAMCEWAVELKEVKSDIVLGQKGDLSDFDYDTTQEESTEDQEWLEGLKLSEKGKVLPTIENVILILDNHKAFKGRIFYDAFMQRLCVRGKLPWHTSDLKSVRPWGEADDASLLCWLEAQVGINKLNVVQTALNTFEYSHREHPVRAYLESLPPHDGVKRVERLFMDYLGAEDTPYTRAAARTHLVASVARVYKPGIKYDTMITLSGAQGIGKSSFIRILAGDDWFTDCISSLTGKESCEALQGFWHVEMGELNAYRKADKEAFKEFLSRQKDSYRMAYARRRSDFLRQCVFWGTTNDQTFLRDGTGERRTWPIACRKEAPKKDIFTDLIEERDQIWSEAFALYKSGHPLKLDEKMNQELLKEQNKFKEYTPFQEIALDYIGREFPVNWDDLDLFERRDWLSGLEVAKASKALETRTRVSALEIWCEAVRKSEADLKPNWKKEIDDVIRHDPRWKDSTYKRMRLGKAYNQLRVYGFVLK